MNKERWFDGMQLVLHVATVYVLFTSHVDPGSSRGLTRLFPNFLCHIGKLSTWNWGPVLQTPPSIPILDPAEQARSVCIWLICGSYPGCFFTVNSAAREEGESQ